MCFVVGGWMHYIFKVILVDFGYENPARLGFQVYEPELVKTLCVLTFMFCFSFSFKLTSKLTPQVSYRQKDHFGDTKESIFIS